MRNLIICLAWTAGAAMPLAGVSAQTPNSALDTVVRAQNAGRCELRILTTDNVAISDGTDFTEGGKVGGIVPALMSELYRKQDPEVIKSFALRVLGPQAQQALISANLTLPGSLASYTTTFESGGTRALDSFKSRKTTPRLSSSTASCQAELTVVVMRWVRTSLYAKMAYLFMFRRFGAAPTPESVITYAALVPVEKFPPRSEVDEKVAAASLTDGFVKTFRTFMQKIKAASTK